MSDRSGLPGWPEWGASVVDAGYTSRDSASKLVRAADLAEKAYRMLPPGDARTLVYRIGSLVGDASKFLPVEGSLDGFPPGRC